MHEFGNIPSTSNEGQRAFVAFYTKGIGDEVMRELEEVLPTASFVSRHDRFVVFSCSPKEIDERRDQIRTVDDLRALVAGPSQVGTGDEFEHFCAQVSKRIDFMLLEMGRANSSPWSITLTVRRPAWRERPVWDPAPLIEEFLNGADVFAGRRQPIDVRILVDGNLMVASLNLWDRPIGKQELLFHERPGSLRRTVAAALVRIASHNAGSELLRFGVYDPFCGTGTIAEEVIRSGLAIAASDVDPTAVEITRARLKQLYQRLGQPEWSAELSTAVFKHDVHAGWPSIVKARLVVGNLPWGKQVRIGRLSHLVEGTAMIAVRVARAGGVAVFLTTDEHVLAAHVRRLEPSATVTIRKIGLLGQTPSIVTIR